MAEPSPATPSSLRPRLWVPGLLHVSDLGEVRTGTETGYLGQAEAFRHGRCGRWGGIDDWTHTAWLVQRSALRPATVAEHALILPETLVDQDRLPHAYRWLHEQPLLCVSGLKRERLVGAGLRLWCVAFDATGHQRLELSAQGGSGARFALSASLRALSASRSESGAPRPALGRHGEPSIIDRVLRHLSNDALSEHGVLQALQARSLVEDGYGYHGQPAGSFRSVEQVEADAEPLDALFGQIFQRGDEQRDLAQQLRRALPRSAVDVDELEIPVYDTARRVPVPELRYALTEEDSALRLEIDGTPQGELVLPSEDRWLVSRVEPWSPRLPAALEQRLGQTSRPRRLSAGSLLGLLLLGLGLLLLMWLGLSNR